jgi:hypothetical protein
MTLAPLQYFWPNQADWPQPTGRPAEQAWTLQRGAEGPPHFDARSRGLLAAPRADAELLAAPGRWVECGEFWVGIADPRPEAHARVGVELSGRPVRLADGQEWRLPICHPQSPACGLRMVERIVPAEASGPRRQMRWVRCVAPEHEWLANTARELAAELLEAVLAGQDWVGGDGRLRDLAVRALAVQYDLTDVEVGAMGLLGPDCYAAVVQCVVDWDWCLQRLTAAAREVTHG